MLAAPGSERRCLRSRRFGRRRFGEPKLGCQCLVFRRRDVVAVRIADFGLGVVFPAHVRRCETSLQETSDHETSLQETSVQETSVQDTSDQDTSLQETESQETLAFAAVYQAGPSNSVVPVRD